MTGNRRRSAILLAALAVGVVAGRPLRAQSLGGGAMAWVVQRRVSYLGTVHEQTGTWFGVGGSARLGRVIIGGSILMGKVAGDSDQQTNPDLDLRVSDLWVHARVTRSVEAGVNLEVRRQEASAGVTSWRLIGPTLRLMPGLGVPGLSGSAEVTYFVSASVVGTSSTMSPAIRATFGATYAPPPGRVELRVSYRFERFDFGAVGTTPARLEQFSGVLVGVGFRLGRDR